MGVYNSRVPSLFTEFRCEHCKPEIFKIKCLSLKNITSVLGHLVAGDGVVQPGPGLKPGLMNFFQPETGPEPGLEIFVQPEPGVKKGRGWPELGSPVDLCSLCYFYIC